MKESPKKDVLQKDASSKEASPKPSDEKKLPEKIETPKTTAPEATQPEAKNLNDRPNYPDSWSAFGSRLVLRNQALGPPQPQPVCQSVDHTEGEICSTNAETNRIR